MNAKIHSAWVQKLILALTLAFALSACNKQPTTVTPHELTSGDS